MPQAAVRLDRRRKGSGCALTETRLVVQGPWEAARGEEQRDKRAEDLDPKVGLVQFAYACCYSLLGETNESLERLERLFALGHDACDQVRFEKDLEQVRRDPRFSELLAQYCK